MIAYLISCDCSIKEKFMLPVGETIIGRGPFLKVADKRVSRSHAVINNTGNNLSIKSLCKKPTFHCPSGLQKLVPLKYNEEAILTNGEKISLLPDALIFSLVVQKEPMERKSSNQSETYSLGSVCEVSSKKRVLPSWMVNLEETASNKKAKKIKPMTQIADQEKSLLHKSSCCTLNKTEDLQTSEEIFVNTSQETVNKSTLEEVPINVAKKPSTSHSQHSALLSNNFTVDASLKQVSKKICPHGLSCYRKNPAHFKEFDHSTDQALHENKEIDTKKIDKPECEYGTSCYRKNLDHWQNYTHSKSHTQKKTKIVTRTKKLKNKTSEILEDCSENKYDLNDSFIDDEVSDEDYKPDSDSSEDDDDDDDEDYCHEQEDD